MIQFKEWKLSSNSNKVPLTILVLALICFIFDEQLTTYLIYNREIIASEQQYWRLITGHLLHTNYAHFLLNTFALMLLWALHHKFYSNQQYLLLFISSAIIISLALFILTPSMNQYVGLSGILHALYIWGALTDIEHKDKTGYLLLLGGLLKVGHEQIYGASEDVESLINASVAIDAHLWGVISGMLFFAISYFLKYKKNSTNL